MKNRVNEEELESIECDNCGAKLIVGKCDKIARCDNCGNVLIKARTITYEEFLKLVSELM